MIELISPHQIRTSISQSLNVSHFLDHILITSGPAVGPLRRSVYYVPHEAVRGTEADHIRLSRLADIQPARAQGCSRILNPDRYMYYVVRHEHEQVGM